MEFTLDLQSKSAYADSEYLEEVISNLIDNSIKYSKDSVQINITAEESNRYTVLKIRDNGLGIAEKDIHLIFQKFERTSAVKRNRRNGVSGFGLGLSFVDQVVKAHEGRIFVTSLEGEFTEFIICLPMANTESPTKLRINPPQYSFNSQIWKYQLLYVHEIYTLRIYT